MRELGDGGLREGSKAAFERNGSKALGSSKAERRLEAVPGEGRGM